MGLELEKARAEEIERSFPGRICMDPVDARILHREPGPPIRDGDHEAFSLLHRHGRGRQFQKHAHVRDEGPHHVVARFDLLLASAQVEAQGKGAELVVVQVAPGFVAKVIFVRGGDAGDGEVVHFGVVAAVVGEAAGFGGRVEGVGGGVAGGGVGALVEAVAGAGEGPVAV